MSKQNRYSQIIESIFFNSYKKGIVEITFSREELIGTAAKLNIPTPKNLGDIIYSFQGRTKFPKSILDTSPEGFEWIIKGTDKGLYKFLITRQGVFEPTKNFAETKIPDATPGIIIKYALNDEQALLAKIRYNRLIDIFTGLTCYSLQNHLRTAVERVQTETDEIYIGIDKRGVHYIIPVQAKGGKDKLGIGQIEKDFAVCKMKFPTLICKPIAAQFMVNEVIALFEFESANGEIDMIAEKHYRLVDASELTTEDLEKYKTRSN